MSLKTSDILNIVPGTFLAAPGAMEAVAATSVDRFFDGLLQLALGILAMLATKLISKMFNKYLPDKPPVPLAPPPSITPPPPPPDFLTLNNNTENGKEISK